MFIITQIPAFCNTFCITDVRLRFGISHAPRIAGKTNQQRPGDYPVTAALLTRHIKEI